MSAEVIQLRLSALEAPEIEAFIDQLSSWIRNTTTFSTVTR